MCNRLDTIPACDGWTDGQTDTLPHSTLYAYASRGKNESSICRPCWNLAGNCTRERKSDGWVQTIVHGIQRWKRGLIERTQEPGRPRLKSMINANELAGSSVFLLRYPSEWLTTPRPCTEGHHYPSPGRVRMLPRTRGMQPAWTPIIAI